jgi:hypothetical protein
MINRITDTTLLTELRTYGMGERAQGVYNECKRIGHHQIAERIKAKYGSKFHRKKHDDMVVAFQIALLATKNNTWSSPR